MLEHKLIEILKTLSKSEFSDFEKFTSSSYHNHGRNYLSVLKSLKHFYPGFNKKNFTKESVFNRAYPGEKFSENMINIAFSRLNVMAEEFLVVNTLRSNSYDKGRMLLEEMYKRKLFGQFDKKAGDLEKLINPDSTFSERFFEEKSILYRLQADKIFSSDEVYSRKQDILKRTEYTLYSVINKIILCRYDLALFQNEFGAEFDTGFVEYFFNNVNIENIIESMSDSGSEYYTILALKYYGILLRTPCDERIFTKYKELFEENFESFSFEEKFVYYNNMAGFCIIKSNQGLKLYDNELLEIYRQMLANNIISHGNSEYFDLSHYRNMLLAALDVNDFQFVETLVNDYSAKLNPEHRDDMANFTLAKLYYAKNEYERSLNNATKVNQEFFLFKIDIKTLMLQLYFDLRYFEELFSLIDSFRHFISGKIELSEGRKIRFLNFLKYLNNFVRALINSDRTKLEKLKMEIKESKNIALISWLEIKIKESTSN